jgi:hypothetical protein
VTLAAEEQFPGQCIRVRYEDLVTDPEATAARIFGFLEAAPMPGISAACFSADRERFGPADYKIWSTSKITADSIGRGWSIPAAMIAPQVVDGINELAGKLGYRPVDGEWGSSAPPADLRVPVSDPGPHPAGDNPGRVAGVGTPAAVEPARHRLAAEHSPVRSWLLGSRLQAGLGDVRAKAASRWEPHGAETMVAIWVPRDPAEPAEHWLVDLKARTVVLASGAAQQDSDWDIVGSAEAWEQVIAGTMNLSVALRACQLRYCDSNDPSPLASDARIAILADLLALASW